MLMILKNSMQIITKDTSQTSVISTGQTADAMTLTYFPDTILLLIVYSFEGFSKPNKMVSII